MRNERLRAQRKLRGWSQEDVVRGLVDVGIEIDERQIGVTRSLISRWERGVTSPRAPYPKLLCLLFKVTAEELGLVSPSPASSSCVTIEESAIEEDVERRELFSLFYTAARAATVWAALPSGSGSSVVHLGVYEHESGPLVEVLTTITGGYRRLDDSTPSYELLPLALGHLHHVSNVLQRSSSEAGRKKLLAVASEASGLVGGLAFDSGNHLQASHHYHAAITLAERAGNTLLQVFSLGMMSYFKAETGHGAVAVELVERGKSLLPADDPPTIQGRMATYEANAYSRIGDVPRALSALNRADTASGQIQADQEMFWPLVFPFDMKRLARERGACATRLKRPEIALPALEEGIKALGSALVSKRRALLLLDLAECYTLAGEAEEACRLTAEAFAIGVQMGSDRALKRVGEVRKELTPWKGTQAVRELDEQLLEGLLGD